MAPVGTTTSSDCLKRWASRSATEHSRRVCHRRARSASSRDTMTSRAPTSSHRLPQRRMALSRVSASPSSSISRMAPASAGKVKGRARTHVVERGLVHQLERARPKPAADDGADRAARRHGIGHDGDERGGRLRLADQAHGDLAGHAERPLAAHEHRHQVVAGHALRRLAPQLQGLAAHQRDGEAQRPVARHPVLEGARSPGVLGDVAAHRAERQAGGIGRIEQPRRFDGRLQVAVHDPGLDDGDPVVGVDELDGAHPLGRQHQPPAHGQRAPRHPAPRPARGHGDAVLGGQPQRDGDLLARAGQHRRVGRKAPEARLVGGIDLEGRLVAQHATGPELAREQLVDVGCHAHESSRWLPAPVRPRSSGSSHRTGDRGPWAQLAWLPGSCRPKGERR